MQLRLVEEELEASQEQREWSDRASEREIAQLVAGADASHSRTDPDLVGPDRTDSTLSAEEAAMRVIRPRPPKAAGEGN